MLIELIHSIEPLRRVWERRAPRHRYQQSHEVLRRARSEAGFKRLSEEVAANDKKKLLDLAKRWRRELFASDFLPPHRPAGKQL